MMQGNFGPLGPSSCLLCRGCAARPLAPRQHDKALSDVASHRISHVILQNSHGHLVLVMTVAVTTIVTLIIYT